MGATDIIAEHLTLTFSLDNNRYDKLFVMSRVLLARALFMNRAAAAGVALLLLIIGGAPRVEAETLAATLTCDAAGVAIEPATTLLSLDLNAPGCVLARAQVQTPQPVDLPASQPVTLSGELPIPHPEYHHVGTWNSDIILERATIHSSRLTWVETRRGECFWRTSHLVSFGDGGAYWVESGLFRCSDGPYVIFVYMGWGTGSPGYVIGPEVPPGATVTTFAEWQYIGNTNLMSGGYFNESGDKVYLIQYDTGTSPCVELNQTDNNGEAYTVRSSHISNFLVYEYAALNTRICDKDGDGNWFCKLWDKTFDTATVERRETYDVNWYALSSLETNSTSYYDWFGRGRGPITRPERMRRQHGTR